MTTAILNMVQPAVSSDGMSSLGGGSAIGKAAAGRKFAQAMQHSNAGMQEQGKNSVAMTSPSSPAITGEAGASVTDAIAPALEDGGALLAQIQALSPELMTFLQEQDTSITDPKSFIDAIQSLLGDEDFSLDDLDFSDDWSDELASLFAKIPGLELPVEPQPVDAALNGSALSAQPVGGEEVLQAAALSQNPIENMKQSQLAEVLQVPENLTIQPEDVAAPVLPDAGEEGDMTDGEGDVMRMALQPGAQVDDAPEQVNVAAPKLDAQKTQAEKLFTPVGGQPEMLTEGEGEGKEVKSDKPLNISGLMQNEHPSQRMVNPGQVAAAQLVQDQKAPLDMDGTQNNASNTATTGITLTDGGGDAAKIQSTESPRGPHFQPGQQVTEQVRVHIQQAAHKGIDTIEVRLNPPELGRVQVHMEMHKDGAARVTFVAETGTALDMLQRDSRDLARALQEMGINASAGDLQFDLREQGGQQARQEDDNNPHGTGQDGGAITGIDSEEISHLAGRTLSSDRIIDISV